MQKYYRFALWDCTLGLPEYNVIMQKKYPNKYLIETGSGLQDVDGLKNSSYFQHETSRYIKGEITLEELDRIIVTYYANKDVHEEEYQEADIVATRIARIISEDSFTFSVGQLLSIHKMLFDGILEHPGMIRTYNFSKKEWVLDGASVTYGDYRELEMALQYDFEQEKKFRYRNQSVDEMIDHLSIFLANLWQIHVFEEGNTRTTAVFFIKYLRSLGFDVTNDTFAKNAWYFRNALVRANYKNLPKGITEDRSYLVLFLRNLLLGENNVLQNRDLHVASTYPTPNLDRKSRILSLLQNNPNITAEMLSKELNVSLRTIKNSLKVLEEEKIIERVNGRRYGHWKICS